MNKPTLKELIDAVFAGKTIQYDFLDVPDVKWKDFTSNSQHKVIAIIAEYYDCHQYRIKPTSQVQQYRIFADTNNKVWVWQSGGRVNQEARESYRDFKQWLGETQEYIYEVEE